MPWCPNCKAEYQPGFTVCSDCKVELVEDIKESENLVPFFQADDKKIAEKLAKFFQYSDLNSKIEYDEANDSYHVLIPPKQLMEAKKLYQAFYYVERERLEQGESDLFDTEEISDSLSDNDVSSDSDMDHNSDQSETNDDLNYQSIDNHSLDLDSEKDTEKMNNETPSDEINAFDEDERTSNLYIMKADQYKDLTGTVWVFWTFGVLGLVFVLLNILGVLNILNGWIPNTVMGILFLFFLYVAITTNQKATKVKAEIDKENKMTEKINNWLKLNVTEDFLSSLHDDNVSEEVNFIRIIDTIKELLIKEFGHQNLSYLDRLIEEFYNENFQ